MAADCFESQLTTREIKVHNIKISKGRKSYPESSDLLIVLAPVYAFRLAEIVEHWIQNMDKTFQKPAAVISVSGGGEMSPNTACREPVKRLLSKKGYRVIYEEMLVMPSNYGTPTPQVLADKLLTILPRKVNLVIMDILDGKQNITTPKKQDRIFTSLGKMEHIGAKFFGASIHASDHCSHCGICVKNCPQKNIHLHNGIPKFGFACIWCMKCIYACPSKALSPRILKSVILKNGYNLKEMYKKVNKEAPSVQHENFEKKLWKGVINYLGNTDNNNDNC